MLSSRKSVYHKARLSKLIAAYVLIPLIEFEFSFYGSNKPWISQSIKNTRQLKVLFAICKSHGWVTGPIKRFRKSELSFKLTNKGFSEIYSLAGPLADSDKDAWARLLVGRTGKFRYLEKRVVTSDDVLSYIKSKKKRASTKDICVGMKRLPNSISRHLKKLINSGLVGRDKNGLYYYKRAPANSSS